MAPPALDAPVHELCAERQPPQDEALAFAGADGRVERLTFGEVAGAVRKLAARLHRHGVGPGVPVAIVLPQCPLAPVAHLALSLLGAVAVPISPLFGPDGLAPRLDRGGAALAIAHHDKAEAVREAAPSLPVWVADGSAARLPDGPEALAARAPEALRGLQGLAPPERPLAILFTSGTTAAPKAVVLPRRVVAGRLAGLQVAHPGLPQPGDRFWSPADWSWIGGLYDALLAPWALGVPVFAYERKGPFDPARAEALLRAHGVRNAFLPPTALRLWMRSGAPAPPLRTLHTAGEPLPPSIHEWAAKAFGATPREVYGLTECAFLLVNAKGEPGLTGEPAPGQEIRVLGSAGAEAPAGEPGELAVWGGSPTMMLGYLEDGAVRLPLDPQGWLATGDLAVRDGAGRFTVLGRRDEVLKVAGYRVAPREVEAALLRHPAVEECAVVGVPDEVRGTQLKAFVRPAPDARADDGLAADLAAFLRERLAAHLVPRSIVFVEQLPRTTSGKIVRGQLR